MHCKRSCSLRISCIVVIKGLDFGRMGQYMHFFTGRIFDPILPAP